MELQAVSGQLELNSSSAVAQLNETALHESILRDESAFFPVKEPNNQHLLLAHQQLCREFGFDAVFSTPLRTPTGELQGAILVAGRSELICGERTPNFVRAAAPRIANAVQVVSRTEQSAIQKSSTN